VLGEALHPAGHRLDRDIGAGHKGEREDQQPPAEQDQAGQDQQGRQDIAAGRPAPVAAEPDHDLEEHREAQEADQPDRDRRPPGNASHEWSGRPG
jgi:hypothetical protein